MQKIEFPECVKSHLKEGDNEIEIFQKALSILIFKMQLIKQHKETIGKLEDEVNELLNFLKD